jgi:hypothetical protein
MRKFSKIPLLGFACLAIAADAYADVTFHGYGQVVMGTTFSNNRTFPAESSSYSYHADPTFTPNSNFALQASAPLSSGITATTQILARGDDDFQPKFQWAYLKYQFNDTFSVKAGRLQLPFYQYSDYQFVGEAYPWVVPPESVYFAQVSTYDGLNFSAEKSLGDWYFFMQAIYGSYSQVSADPVSTPTGVVNTNVNIHGTNLTGFSLDTTYNDWLELRLAAFYENLTVASDGNPANPLSAVDTLASLSKSLGYDATKVLETSNDPNLYYVASAQITRNNWLLLAEFQGLKPIAGADGVAVPQITSEYISLGRHFGKWLPIATFGHRNQWTGATRMKEQIAPALDVGIDALAGNPQLRLKDYFYEFGLRYDLTATVALKLDYTFYQSHYKTTDYPVAASLGGATNPSNANRLLAAVTFSF